MSEETKIKNMRQINEIKEEIKHFEWLLAEPDCDFESQVWIGLKLKELKKELKESKKFANELHGRQAKA